MSTRQETYPAPRPPTPKPVPGDNFRKAVALPIEGQKRRKLLCLIAAYHDADYAPSVRELRRQLPFVKRSHMGSIRQIDALLEALERDGWITVHRGPRPTKNRYELHLDRG